MPVRDLIGKRGQAMKTKPAARGRSNENAIFARILKANDGDLPPRVKKLESGLGDDDKTWKATFQNLVDSANSFTYDFNIKEATYGRLSREFAHDPSIAVVKDPLDPPT